MRKTVKYIQVSELCNQYQVDMTFFLELRDNGLIQCFSDNQELYIKFDQIGQFERMIRMRQDLDLNVEGMDIVVQLLQKIDEMRSELHRLQNRLRLYENE